jgi:hypothetical protein
MGGDRTAEMMAASSRKLMEKLAAEHPDTPWAVLARRERLTGLGLEWKAIK